MADQTPPRSGYPNTYFVQDRSNQDELARLQVLDQILTAGMGGVLSEQPDPSSFNRVLDVGCGTGGWLIETAKTYPHISLLIGVDASKRMIEHARAQAEAQQVIDRVEFHVMDALLILEFPDEFFDLVNHRGAASWLRTWDWSKLLSEYQRISRPGAVIRVTEGDWLTESTSPALTQLYQMTLQTVHRAGYYFTQESSGITDQLARIMRQHGIQNVQTQMHTVEFRAGTPEGQLFYENMRLGYRTSLPFLRKWTRVPDDYEAIYQQALVEMQQPDFVTTWELLTAWGTKSGRDTSHDFLYVP
jgi:ubiquinone/menaquinone biosynthesis C-methylase UbiE